MVRQDDVRDIVFSIVLSMQTPFAGLSKGVMYIAVNTKPVPKVGQRSFN